VNHGAAPYQHNPHNAMSYFVRIETPSGEREIWGVDLQRALTPIRQTVETRAAERPDLRDVFLCHAWDDRQGPAKELHNLLVAAGVKVWFS